MPSGRDIPCIRTFDSPALEAGVHKAANTDVVTHRHLGNLGSHGGHDTSSLVTRHARVNGVAHVILRAVQVAVANSTEFDVDHDVERTGLVTHEVHRSQVGLRRSCSQTLCRDAVSHRE